MSGQVLDLSPLSQRELEVYGYLAEGKTSRQIAHELGLGLETIRGYRKCIKRKLRPTEDAWPPIDQLGAVLERSLKRFEEDPA